MNYLKSYLFTMLAASLFAVSTHAQSEDVSLNAEVDAEIERMYVAPQGAGSANMNRTQIVVVPQQATVQKQPVTVIEASPLSNSNADAIRKNRQEEELRTETRIVEKLEISRMEDEKRRAQTLFGDRFDSLNNQQPAQTQPIQSETIVAPSSHVQPQPIIVQQTETIDRDVVHEEVRAALAAEKEVAEDDYDGFDRRYMSFQAGMPMYSSAQAIKGNYSVGMGVGAANDFFEVEGGFIYSSFKVENAAYLTQYPYMGVAYADHDMNQYQGYLSGKFIVFTGSIRPTVGGILAYSYRTYEVSPDRFQYAPPGMGDGNTSAIDAGVTAGVDIKLSRRFSLGADFKYMFNMSSNLEEGTVPGYKSPEKMNYYVLGVAGKMSF